MKVIKTGFNRDDRGFGVLLNVMGYTGHAVEVGSAFGGHARKILEFWKGKRLTLVDLWARQSSDIYREDTSSVDYDLWFRQCQQLAKEDPRVDLVRSFSVDAAKTFPDKSLDFVYIDANHSYEAVFEDLIAWEPKVSGILAGHDFWTRVGNGHYAQVETALEGFLPKDQEVFVGTCQSWWTFLV